MAAMMKADSFAGTGGKIAYRSWAAEGTPRAVLVICHGFNSHSGQYAWVAEQFASRGLAVYAADLRGRGKSEGARFFVDNVGEYVSDVSGMIKLAKSRNPGLKVFLLGHSAGGVTSVSYALDNQNELAGLISEDFAYKAPAPDFILRVFVWLSGLLPKLPILTLKNADFSRDPKRVAELDADPLTKNEKQPLRSIAALVIAGDRMHRDFGTIRIPVLIVHGTADKAALLVGSQEFFDKAGSKDKTLKLYDGYFHDLLADTGKEAVVADIQAWLDKHI
jgi:alpha-beta hydrolase superfamily lysophospholipase